MSKIWLAIGFVVGITSGFVISKIYNKKKNLPY